MIEKREKLRERGRKYKKDEINVLSVKFLIIYFQFTSRKLLRSLVNFSEKLLVNLVIERIENFFEEFCFYPLAKVIVFTS